MKKIKEVFMAMWTSNFYEIMSYRDFWEFVQKPMPAFGMISPVQYYGENRPNNPDCYKEILGTLKRILK